MEAGSCKFRVTIGGFALFLQKMSFSTYETLYYLLKLKCMKSSHALIILISIEIKNVWGHVNVFARGAGQAVAQLDVNYGIDYEPFKVSLKQTEGGLKFLKLFFKITVLLTRWTFQ